MASAQTASETPGHGALLAHIARLHYVRRLSRQQIGEQLGISRFKVARLLEEARESGIVRFQITDPLPLEATLGDRLADAYGLELALVASEARDSVELGQLAATWIPDLLPERAPVGVAWGATLQAVADFLPAIDHGSAVVQICGAIAGLSPGTGPSELAMRFAERLGGRLHSLPAPAVTSRAAYQELIANDALRPTLRKFDELGAALVGIGRADRFPGAPAEAEGHLLVHLFNAAGAPVSAHPEAIALGATVEQLRRTRVIAVAGGVEKREAVLACLWSGLINVLVTDRSCARHAIDSAPRDQATRGGR